MHCQNLSTIRHRALALWRDVAPTASSITATPIMSPAPQSSIATRSERIEQIHLRAQQRQSASSFECQSVTTVMSPAIEYIDDD